MRFPKRLIAFASLMSVVFIAGCPEGSDVDPSARGASIYSKKDGKAFVLLDLQPQAARLRRLSQAERQDYLLKCAVEAVQQPDMDRADLRGFEQCVVRLVLVVGRDSYDRPDWGNAVEIALVEISRAKAAQAHAAPASHHGQALRDCFTQVTIHHDRIR